MSENMDQINNNNNIRDDLQKNVTINEDYAAKTQEEVDQILKNCADIYIRHLYRKQALENMNRHNDI